MNEIRIGFYRHCKGGLYFVFGVFNHTETTEKLVVYAGNTGFWVRPLQDFAGEHPELGKRFKPVVTL